MKNYFDVAGKYAVVTGASSGLGRQFALCLAEQGCNVAIAARRVERLEEVKKEVEAYGVKCLVLPCDVTDTEQIRNSVDKVVKEFGRIDILINNAAASFATPVVETTDDQWYNVMKTNVDGVFFFAREVGKVMIAQNYGKIINIGSLGSYIGLEESSVYCSTKGGVIQLSKTMAIELGPYHIQVNCLAPGYFITPMTQPFYDDPKHRAWIESRIPLHEWGTDLDLAGPVLFLASAASDYVTGETIKVDGGWLAS